MSAKFNQYIIWPDILSFQTPFTLTLRIWDIYILEGEKVLPAMSYTILKLHKSKRVDSTQCEPAGVSNISLTCVCVWLTEHLMKLSMEDLVEFLQVTLSKNFFFEDDFVIEQLHTSMTELRRAKLDLPAPGKQTLTVLGCDFKKTQTKLKQHW